MKYDVFISYRRDGGDTLSQLIYDRLTHRGYRVFLDIESLNAGKFNEKLLEVIEGCKDMVIVLPPNGLDRCRNEGDWVFRELEHAMKLKKNIVPVLMKGFEWPDDLPEAIADIQNYNGIIDNKDYFDAVIDKMTTLLTSRPAVGGNAFRKLGERSTTIKSQVKKRKRIIFGIIFLLFACIAAFAGLKYTEKQRRMAEQENVVIRLMPSDDMNASEFYDVAEIVKERFDILADGEKYSFEDEKGEIKVVIPESVFHEVDIQQTMQCYVTRPTEIYLATTWDGDWNREMNENEYFHIDRDAIESVELVTEVPGEVDFGEYELYGVESEEDCQYFALTVDDETAKAAKAWMEETQSEGYELYQDLVEYGRMNSYYYKIAGSFENDNVLYFVDNYQYSNYLNLILHNYQNETSSKPFYFSIKLPVDWEYDDNEEVSFGENQCNIDEIDQEHFARYDFRTYADEFTEGEQKDILNTFKKRLDSLGIPYAFGYQGEGIQNISVAINPDYMNSIVSDYLGGYCKIEVKSRFYELMGTAYIENVEIVENADGSYQLELIPSETWHGYEKQEGIDQISKDEEIFLCISDSPDVILDASTVSEAFDGEKFVFDSLSGYGLETIEAEEKFVFDFLKVLNETEIPNTYSVEVLHTDLEEDEIELIIPESTAGDERKEFLENAIEEAGITDNYEITVTKAGQSVRLDIFCPENEDYVEYVNHSVKEIYEKCNLKTGDIAYFDLSFYKGQKKTEAFSLIISISYYTNNLQIYGSFYGIEDAEKQAINHLINEDEFYKQFYVSDIYIKDGEIIF